VLEISDPSNLVYKKQWHLVLGLLQISFMAGGSEITGAWDKYV
jgi:hypothetical protein